jgi:2-keto-3-deoxy-L-rhamnonate aldolase RhmA
LLHWIGDASEYPTPEMTPFQNNLHARYASGLLCKAFSIKISSNIQVVLLARNAGFDALFIDLEHGWLSVAEASTLCITGLLAGVTPFVRVPHQCGNGFIQRVLDGGAMGVVFPHIHSAGKLSKLEGH